MTPNRIMTLGVIALLTFNGCALIRCITECKRKIPQNPVLGDRQPEGGSETPQGVGEAPTSTSLDVTGRTDTPHRVKGVKKKPPGENPGA